MTWKHLLPLRSIYHFAPPYVQGHTLLWNAVKICFQHNSDAALFTFGATAINLHFQSLVNLKGGAPVMVLYGEPDVGKTTIANAVMSVLEIEACTFNSEVQRESILSTWLLKHLEINVW